MKNNKTLKSLGTAFSMIGLVASGIALFLGLQRIGAAGFGALGVICIAPSIIAIVIILLDLKVTKDENGNGLVFSIISSLIKIVLFIALIPSTIYSYNYEMRFGVSNLTFDLILEGLLLITAIPSIINAVRIIREKKQN